MLHLSLLSLLSLLGLLGLLSLLSLLSLLGLLGLLSLLPLSLLWLLPLKLLWLLPLKLLWLLPLRLLRLLRLLPFDLTLRLLMVFGLMAVATSQGQGILINRQFNIVGPYSGQGHVYLIAGIRLTDVHWGRLPCYSAG